MQLVTYIVSDYKDSRRLRCVVPVLLPPLISVSLSFFNLASLIGIGLSDDFWPLCRALIVWVYAVDIFQIWQSVSTLWHYTVANFNNPAALADGPWEYASLPIFGSLLVLCFFVSS